MRNSPIEASTCASSARLAVKESSYPTSHNPNRQTPVPECLPMYETGSKGTTWSWFVQGGRAQPHHIIYDKISESEERIDELKPIRCKEGVTVTTVRYAELEVV